MEIDKSKCVGCGNCIPWCTMGVIHIGEDDKAEVNQEECVECQNCHRSLRVEGYPPLLVRAIRKVLNLLRLGYLALPDVCPTGALTPPQLEWPRTLRLEFSDPATVHPSTGMHGRGTEEIKTNDVRGRLRQGEVGFVVELGRPGTGTRFRDVERMALALAPLGAQFEAKNPVTVLMTDTKTGKMREDVLEEKVLSAIIELKTTMDKVPAFLERIKEASREIDTVCSVGIAAKCGPDGSVPYEEIVEKAGWRLSPNTKTNLGLGRPLFVEERRGE